jgi:hypothetical protein
VKIVLQQAGMAPKVRPGYTVSITSREKMREDVLVQHGGAKGSSWIPSPAAIQARKKMSEDLCWCTSWWRQRFVLDTPTGEHYKKERR